MLAFISHGQKIDIVHSGPASIRLKAILYFDFVAFMYFSCQNEGESS
jgi:hypothetical protein